MCFLGRCVLCFLREADISIARAKLVVSCYINKECQALVLRGLEGGHVALRAGHKQIWRRN